jgi:uncharacterized protein (DUF486 family)
MRTAYLLIASNLMMNIAWYWHLLVRNGRLPLWGFVIISWMLALPEYALAVPANRFGHIAQGGTMTTSQLKILQEGISVGTFLLLNLLVLRSELPRPRDLIAFVMILGGLFIALSGRRL